MINNLTMLINSLGLKVGDKDTPLLTYLLEDKTNEILVLTNLKTLPKALEHVVIKRALGEYLSINNNNYESINEPVLQSITRGDVSMTYKADTNKTDIASTVNSLQSYGQNLILKHRVIRWS